MQLLQEVAASADGIGNPAELASRAASLLLPTANARTSSSEDSSDEPSRQDPGKLRQRRQWKANAAQTKLQRKEWALKRETSDVEYYQQKLDKAKEAAERLAEEVAQAQDAYDSALLDQSNGDFLGQERKEEMALKQLFDPDEVDDDPELRQEIQAVRQQHKQRVEQKRALARATAAQVADGGSDADMAQDGARGPESPEASEDAPRPGGNPPEDEEPQRKKQCLTVEQRKAKIETELQKLREEREQGGGWYDFRSYQQWGGHNAWNASKWKHNTRSTPYGKWAAGGSQPYW